MAEMTISKPMDTRELAEFLGCSVRWLELLRKNEEGPDYYLQGRIPKYRISDVLAWQEKKVQERKRAAARERR